MARRKYDHLTDARGIAELLSVGRKRVYDLMNDRRKPPFPEPVRILQSTPVWDIADVARWARVSGLRDELNYDAFEKRMEELRVAYYADLGRDAPEDDD